jgi:hypothetical protein
MSTPTTAIKMFKSLMLCETFSCNYIKTTVFWDVTPCSLVDHQCFGGTACLHLQDARRHSSNLKMEIASSSETMITSYQTAQHHIPEDSNLEYYA